ncbi:hypothetical protein LSPH26S_03840 [Lysinibacillus sphaericus]
MTHCGVEFLDRSASQRRDPVCSEPFESSDHAVAGQPLVAGFEQLNVVALHIEIVGALGVGERRRVDEDQPVVAAVALQEVQRVELHQPVVGAGETIQREVARSPFQVGRREVHAGGFQRATACTLAVAV